MSIYHENKSTYSRLMGGDGTALSDASGALEVHSGSKSHMTSELLATTWISAGTETDTSVIDLGVFGAPPDWVRVYFTNSGEKSTDYTPRLSYNASFWISGTADTAVSAGQYSIAIQPPYNRYIKVAIRNNDVDDNAYSANASWYQ